MSRTVAILLFIAAIIIVAVIATYNRLIALIEAIRNNQKQIDIQLCLLILCPATD